MAERNLLGTQLSYEERVALAQLTTQPGWDILVRMIAEACRNATEQVIKLDPSSDRYADRVVALQTTARAMNKFSGELLDSIKVHQRNALQETKKKENPELDVPTTRFKGFQLPQVPTVKQSPPEGE